MSSTLEGEKVTLREQRILLLYRSYLQAVGLGRQQKQKVSLKLLNIGLPSLVEGGRGAIWHENAMHASIDAHK